MNGIDYKRLQIEASRWYNADGTWDTLKSPEDVIEKRKEAARKLEEQASRIRLLEFALATVRQIVDKYDQDFLGHDREWSYEDIIQDFLMELDDLLTGVGQ